MPIVDLTPRATLWYGFAPSPSRPARRLGSHVASAARAGVAALLVSTVGCQSPYAECRSPAQVPASTSTVESNALKVAVTVDDLPVHGPATPGMDRMAIADRLLSAFERHGLRSVYGFVNGKRVTDDPSTEAVLLRWRDVGHPLGNHTFSHVSLNAVAASDYFADIEKGEHILKKLEPDARVWKVFRYPFLHEGDTLQKRIAVRDYLSEQGYAMAPVSIDADDWAFNPPFARCAGRRDAQSLANLRRRFVEVHVDELRRMRDLCRRLLGREVPQVLLLHIGPADADAIEDLLTAYEKEGVKWVDLRTALADPMYGLDSGDVVRYGAALPYRLATARGIPAGPPIFARELENELARTCSDP